MVGIDPDSDGLRHARAWGMAASADGAHWLLAQRRAAGHPDRVRGDQRPDPRGDGAGATRRRASLRSISRPAAVGPAVIPTVNLTDHLDRPNLNMITCGGQATIPIVAAVSRVVAVPYAEIVSTVASRSAGPGTRANIDEFTETTAHGLSHDRRRGHGKAIIILNPADPPILMRNTVYCALPDGADEAAIERLGRGRWPPRSRPTSRATASRASSSTPARSGRRAAGRPVGSRSSSRSTGDGDYLPPYAGNLDIMTAAAVRVGEDAGGCALRRRPVRHDRVGHARSGRPPAVPTA